MTVSHNVLGCFNLYNCVHSPYYAAVERCLHSLYLNPCERMDCFIERIFAQSSPSGLYRPARYSEQQSRWTEMMIVDIHAFIMASTVTRSQSNRAPLGCGGTRDSHHGCADDKSAATVWCYHDNMTNISEECFQHLVESVPRRIKTVLKEKGGPIKWPVCMELQNFLMRSHFQRFYTEIICERVLFL